MPRPPFGPCTPTGRRNNDRGAPLTAALVTLSSHASLTPSRRINCEKDPPSFSYVLIVLPVITLHSTYYRMQSLSLSCSLAACFSVLPFGPCWTKRYSFSFVNSCDILQCPGRTENDDNNDKSVLQRKNNRSRCCLTSVQMHSR